jgi:hypothetical protein
MQAILSAEQQAAWWLCCWPYKPRPFCILDRFVALRAARGASPGGD